MADNTILNTGTGGDTIRDLDRSGVKTQVVALDGGGASGESLVSATNPLPISLAASTFVFSTVNTSTAQLAAGAKFTGGIEAIPNQPAISLLMTSDQPMTVLVRQFIDAAGVYAVPNLTTMPTPVPAGTGTSFSVPANGNYCQIVVQNVGSATTTTFNLNTAYGNIDASTQLGNRQTAINEIGGVAVSGTLPVSGTVAVSNIPSFDPLDTATPKVSRIVGRPDGDFKDVDLIEALMDDGSGLSANVRVVNPPKQDVNGATILSDAPVSIELRGSVNTVLYVDTSGYDSLAITVPTGSSAQATVTMGNDLAGPWATVPGVNLTSSVSATSFASSSSYMWPCLARYIRFTFVAGGRATAYLRRVSPGIGILPFSQAVINTQTGTASNNITQLNATNIAPTITTSAGTATMPITTAGSSSYVMISAQALNSNSTQIDNQHQYGGVFSASVNFSSVSGTSPTLDFVIQESPDGGSAWYDIYHCERATTAGVLNIPGIPVAGKRRYSWTVGGGTPSFTTTLTVSIGMAVNYPIIRQFFDRTAGLLAGTASATSAAYTMAGCKTITAAITIGAATTGGMYKLQGSTDGANWYDLSTNVTAVANSTVQITNTAGVVARFVRLFVATAATAQTGTVVAITGTN
ncbi:MAG: hypothetical protein KGI54_08900 [Pseudomonadota bacterium]|nr:hypothetical protein [Pseudomonadota bacterium]